MAPLHPEVLATHVRSLIDQRFVSLNVALQALLTEEIEGAGEIIVLTVDSPSHSGLIKITAVSVGAKNHRVSRLQGEFPRSRVACVFARPFHYRLRSEKRIHQRLKMLDLETPGSKWFRMQLELAIRIIEEERRSEGFR